MNKSEQINELATALVSFQGEMQTVQKDRTAKVKMKNGGEYSYDYADLATIIEASQGPLSKNGLAVSQLLDCDDKGMYLETTVMHKSGQWISGRCPVPGDCSAQELGSEITYRRRYAFCAALKIVSEEDDDANRKPQAPAIKNPTTIKAPVIAPSGGDGATCCNTKMRLSQFKGKNGEDQFYCTICRQMRAA